MLTKIEHKKVTWAHLESPSAKEVDGLSKSFYIHPLIAEELISPTLRPKVDAYNDSIYLILHFPVYNPVSQINLNCEIDFVIGKDFLITAQYGPLAPLEDFVKDIQAKKEMREKNFSKHAGILAFHIIKELYEFSLRQLDHLHVKINKTEENIFTGQEKKMVKKISFIKKEILDFRRTIYLHGTVLNSFEIHGIKFFNKDFGHYMGVLLGEYIKIKNLIESNKETIDSLYATNESLLTNKTNEIMKTLTIMAFITFPLMLFSGIFGMNTVSTPIVGIRLDFWIIIFLMVVATISMFAYFKKKKWL